VSLLDLFKSKPEPKPTGSRKAARARRLKAERQARWRAKRKAEQPFVADYQPVGEVPAAQPVAKNPAPARQEPSQELCPVCCKGVALPEMGGKCSSCWVSNARAPRRCHWCQSHLVVANLGGVDACPFHLEEARAAERDRVDAELAAAVPDRAPYFSMDEAEEQRARAGTKNLPAFNVFDAQASPNAEHGSWSLGGGHVAPRAPRPGTPGLVEVKEWSIEGEQREALINKLKTEGRVAPKEVRRGR